MDQMILTLHREGVKSAVIAERLNQAGHRSTRGVPFNDNSVRQWLSRYSPSPRHRPPPPLNEHEWSVADLARRLKVSVETVRSWVRRGELKARHSDESVRRLIVHADEAKLEYLAQRLKNLAQSKAGGASTIDVPPQP